MSKLMLGIFCAVMLQTSGQARAAQAEAAETAFSTATAAGMQDVSAIEAGAMEKVIKGDTAGALADMDAVVAAEPTSSAFAARARLNMRIRHYREAAKDFGTALIKDPKNQELLYMRALSELKAGQPQQAVELIGKLLAEAPHYPDAHLLRAEAYSELGKFKKAEADFDSEIKLFPDKALAYLSRGYFRLSEGKGEAAYADFQRCRQTSSLVEAGMAETLALILQGKCEESRNRLGNLLLPERVGFSQQEATAVAAYILGCQQKPEEAASFIGKVCRKAELPFDEMKQGGLLAPLFKGMEKQAMSNLEKECQTAPAQ